MGHPCQDTRYLAYLDTMGVGTSVDLATSLNSRSLQEGYNLHTVCAFRVDVRISFGSYNEKGKQVGGNCPLAMDLIMNVACYLVVVELVALPFLQSTPFPFTFLPFCPGWLCMWQIRGSRKEEGVDCV